ncbi:MAG: hypothetical protein UT32_C0036G0006 [Parcubacteria group bacterium GW2011_GWC2_39_14]|nr:MAG: hypothetical protein UT32_C0036G0006 [Parcubacteria group bacterium GW2011_GWC2_39_14]KKR53691.1 MAG: hypothetical protein UT91_C0024G0014 [Parcubacteria group bacterium GW2011_GWA2_40_23]
MNSFFSKKISSIQTLGEKLTAHRQSLGLSQDKAARLININVRYIKLFEKNNYRALPADVYSKNILKRYAELLKLNPHMVIETFNKEELLYQKTQKAKNILEVKWWHKIVNFFLNPRFIKYVIVFIVLAAVIYYLGWSVNRIISAPPLDIISPSENFITTERQVEVIGKTQKEVNVKINNQAILTDLDGNFKITLDLQNNLNIIKISAQKKHSKEQIIYRQVIVKEEELAP